jgi:acylglycerol lipase
MRIAFLIISLVIPIALAACVPGGPLPPVDGPEVPRRTWVPDEPPRAVVLAVHGFNDYSNAFTGFGEYAAAQGVAVYAYDQRGFGARLDAGFWPGVPVLVTDLRIELDRLATLHPDLPVYLLGESMGAAVVIAAATGNRPLEAAGVILSAPAVWGGDQLNPFYRATLWLASHVTPGLMLTGRGLRIQASDNIEMLRALGADPLVIKGTRIDAIAGLVRLMDRAYAGAGSLPGPLLILGGARDEVVPPAAHQAMLERIRAEACSEAVYPDGYHMLLRDRQRQVVWDDILAWLDGAPPPSGLARACGDALSPVVASLR